MPNGQWPSKTSGHLRRKRLRSQERKFRKQWTRWAKRFLKAKGYVVTSLTK